MIIKISNKKTNIKAVSKYNCNYCNQKQIGKYIDIENKVIYYCINCANNYRRVDSKLYIKKCNSKNSKITLPSKLMPTNLKQKQASNYIINAIKQQKDFLVLAVCGAGKTNIIYQPIFYFLNSKKIAYVSPRKNLTKAMYDDFCEYYNPKEIKLINGNVKTTMKLNFMTTHQLINYDAEFDIIFLDEPDAFPFNGNLELEKSLKKSIKTKGSIIYLSATISKFIINEFKHKKNNYINISKRYHGLPLPTPKKIKFKNFLQLNIIIKDILLTNNKVIIFVDGINKAVLLKKKLNYDVELVHSKIKNVDEKISNFKKAKDQILVSTTLLERGFNFNNVSVIIFEPESNIFNIQSLIQISGRVNRNPKLQTGEVILLYKENTIKIKQLKKYTMIQNKEV